MFNAIFNKTPEAAALGTFTVQNGNLIKGTIPLVTWFNDKSVIIGMNARASFSLPAEHQMFDQLLLELMTRKIGVMYVDSVSNFMNPDARFGEFLNRKLDVASVGIDLSDDQANLPEIYAEVKAKFDAMFTAPTPIMSPGIDLSRFFTGDDIAVIEMWRNNNRTTLPSSILNKIDKAGQEQAGLLRLFKVGNIYRVENDRGHVLAKSRFLAAFQLAKNNWAGDIQGYLPRLEVKQSGQNYNSCQRWSIEKNHVVIGCQKVPRAEIEAMAAKISTL